MLLLFNGVAAGGLPRGLIAKSQGASKLAEFFGKTKQFGAGVVVAWALTCGMMACTKDEVTNTLQKEQSRVATLDYDRSATLDEITTALEQMEGSQLGIIKNVDQQGELTIESDDGIVYLQLLEGEVLVNNGESPLKVTLTEEVIDEGLVAEGSLVAVVPAAALSGALLLFTGLFVTDLWVYGESLRRVASYTVILSGVSAGIGLGIYYLIVLL